MGVMKELLQSAQEICDICQGHKEMPHRCQDCKRYVTIGGEKILIKPETLEVLAIQEGGE